MFKLYLLQSVIMSDNMPSPEEQGYNDQKYGLKKEAIELRDNKMDPVSREKYLAGIKADKWDGYTHGETDTSQLIF